MLSIFLVWNLFTQSWQTEKPFLPQESYFKNLKDSLTGDNSKHLVNELFTIFQSGQNNGIWEYG